MTPLHSAVIEDNFAALENKVLVDEWIDVPDELGFTALEIAKLLREIQGLETARRKTAQPVQVAASWHESAGRIITGRF